MVFGIWVLSTKINDQVFLNTSHTTWQKCCVPTLNSLQLFMCVLRSIDISVKNISVSFHYDKCIRSCDLNKYLGTNIILFCETVVS